MRKTVIFAEDSRDALETVARELGPAALILETRRVKDGVEIVAGVQGAPSALAQRESFTRVLEEVRAAKLLADERWQTGATPTTPPASAAPSAQPSREDRIQQIMVRLDEITAMLRKLPAPEATPAPAGPLGALLDWGLAADLATELTGAGQDGADGLHQRLQVPGFMDRLAGVDLVFIHGASGAGKSSTLTRIAAELKRREPGRRLLLATTDEHKVGAGAYARQMGRLLQAPVIESAGDFGRFVSCIEDGYTICVDLPSDLALSYTVARRLLELFAHRFRVYPLIALESALSGRACRAILEGARDIARHVVLTKIDEVPPDGELISSILTSGARIAACAQAPQSLAGLTAFTPALLRAWVGAGQPGMRAA